MQRLTSLRGILLAGLTMLSASSAYAAIDLRNASVTELDNRLLPAIGVPRHRVAFHHIAEDALGRARRGAGTAVLLPAPAFDAVVTAATGGELLPEKATSFQPKPSAGVLMRSLRDEDAGHG